MSNDMCPPSRVIPRHQKMEGHQALKRGQTESDAIAVKVMEMAFAARSSSVFDRRCTSSFCTSSFASSEPTVWNDVQQSNSIRTRVFLTSLDFEKTKSRRRCLAKKVSCIESSPSHKISNMKRVIFGVGRLATKVISERVAPRHTSEWSPTRWRRTTSCKRSERSHLRHPLWQHLPISWMNFTQSWWILFCWFWVAFVAWMHTPW